MKESTSNKINSFLLPDKPTDKDEFGGHSKIAKALEHIILHDSGGVSIALSGDYGSGKSSVINLLTDKLNKKDSTNEYHVFTFDAWEHQQDPIRRSFIEKFVDDLDGKWLYKENSTDAWKVGYDSINNRASVTEVESYPKATFRAFISALIVIVLIPLGLVLLNSGLDGSNMNEGLRNWGIILLLTPVIYPIFYALVSLFSDKIKYNEAYSIFKYEDFRKEVTKTIKTPDPTTIEFRDVFQKIVKSVLEKRNRNLIIVVDNLDRLESSKAIEIWSSLLTYLSQINTIEEKWVERTWVIAPFDLDSIKQLWTDEKEGEVGNEFVKKTFQVRLNVPPVILSNWKKYFREHFDYVFPDLDKPDDVRFNVITLYEDNVSSKTPPTPRDIKIFLNNLSAIYRQRGEEIGLTELAFFLIKKDELDDGGIKEKLEEDKFLSSLEAEILSENWKELIAAIYFNVPIKEATEVLIGNDVRTALLEGDSDLLFNLKETPGYSGIIKNISFEILDEPSPIIVANIALAIKNKVGIDKITYERIWERTEKAFLNLDSLDKVQQKFGEGCKSIFNKTNNLENTVNHALKLFSTVELSSDNIPNWVSSLSPVIEYLERNGLIDNLSEINVQIGSASELQLINAISRSSHIKPYIKYFLPKENLASLIQSIQQNISQRKFEYIDLDLFNLLVSLDKNEEYEDIKWDQIRDSVQQQFTVRTNLTTDEVYIFLSLILYLYSYGIQQFDDYLKKIQTEPIVPHYLNKHWDHTQTASLCIIFLLLFNPDGNTSRNEGASNNGINQFNKFKNQTDIDKKIKNDILDEIKRIGLVNQLIDNAPNQRTQLSLYKILLQAIIEKLSDFESLSLEIVINNTSNIFPHVQNRTAVSLVKKLSDRHQEFVDQVIKKLSFEQGNFTTFEYIITTPNLAREDKLVEFLIDKFQKINKSDWIVHFEKSKHLMNILIHLIQDDYELSLGQEYSEALIQFSNKLKNGKATPAFDSGLWKYLVLAIDKDKREAFYNKLLDLIKGDIPKSPILLKHYSDVITTKEYFKNRAATLATEIILPLIELGNEEGLNWLLSNTTWVDTILKNLEKEDLVEFNKEANDYYSQHDNVTRDLIKNLSLEINSINDLTK